MDKQAAPTIIPMEAVGNWLRGAIANHPKIWNTTKIGLGGTGGYIGGKALTNALIDKQTGQATYGDPGDLYTRGSYLSTLNPISSVTGGIDKVPEWYVKLFPKTKGGLQAAHQTFKAGAVGLLAAGLVGGYRALKHYDEMEELEEADRPSKDLASQHSAREHL